MKYQGALNVWVVARPSHPFTNLAQQTRPPSVGQTHGGQQIQNQMDSTIDKLGCQDNAKVAPADSIVG